MASSNSTLGWKVLIAVSLIILCLITVYPFWYVLIHSFSDPVTGAKAVLWPIDFFYMNYKVVFLTPGLLNAYAITLFRVSVGIPLYLLITGMTAFVFSRREFAARKKLIWFYLIPMYFDGGMIAFYVWMRQIGMYNTLWMYILPASLGLWAMVVMKTAFREIPESLIEAGFMDGAGYFRIFTSVIVPLSLPMFATIGLFAAVTYFNDWTVGTFYMEDQKKWTLQTFLQLSVLKGRAAAAINYTPGGSYGSYNVMDWRITPQEWEKLLKLDTISMETAYVVVSTFPILLLYPFIQRFFIKGVMIGSIKE